jgi:hypothetical protein
VLLLGNSGVLGFTQRNHPTVAYHHTPSTMSTTLIVSSSSYRLGTSYPPVPRSFTNPRPARTRDLCADQHPQLIAEGSSKLASVPSGGGGGAVSSAPAAASGGAAAAEEEKPAAKEEEKEESDDDMVSCPLPIHVLVESILKWDVYQGFGLFD